MKNLLVLLIFLVPTLARSDDAEFNSLFSSLSLEQKIDLVELDGNSPDIAKRRLAKKLLSYHLASNYSMKWQGNAHGLIDVRSKMEKVRPLVRELATSNNFDERTAAIGFMRYLTIDEEVERLVYSILEKDTTIEGQRNCYDAIELLFAYKLETPELRQLLVQGLVDPKTREKYPYTMGTELYAGKWNLTESVDNLLINVMEYYKQNGNVRCGALVSLKELGYSARSVLPQVKKLLEERSKDPSADFREIELLNYTIISMEKQTQQASREHYEARDPSVSQDKSNGREGESEISRFRKIFELFGILLVFIALVLWMFRNRRKMPT